MSEIKDQKLDLLERWEDDSDYTLEDFERDWNTLQRPTEPKVERIAIEMRAFAEKLDDVEPEHATALHDFTDALEVVAIQSHLSAPDGDGGFRERVDAMLAGSDVPNPIRAAFVLGREYEHSDLLTGEEIIIQVERLEHDFFLHPPQSQHGDREREPSEKGKKRALAFNRLLSLMAQAYGEDGFPGAPEFVARAVEYAVGINLGTVEWKPGPGPTLNTPEEEEILAIATPSPAQGEREKVALKLLDAIDEFGEIEPLLARTQDGYDKAHATLGEIGFQARQLRALLATPPPNGENDNG